MNVRLLPALAILVFLALVFRSELKGCMTPKPYGRAQLPTGLSMADLPPEAPPHILIADSLWDEMVKFDQLRLDDGHDNLVFEGTPEELANQIRFINQLAADRKGTDTVNLSDICNISGISREHGGITGAMSPDSIATLLPGMGP